MTLQSRVRHRGIVRMAVILVGGGAVLAGAWYLTEPPEVVQASGPHRIPPASATSAAFMSMTAYPGMDASHFLGIDPGMLRDPFAPINPSANLNRPSAQELAKANAAAAAAARRVKKVELPPPPAPVVVVATPPAPPPAPQAPALPFTYRGGQQSARITGGTATAFLSDSAGNNFVVRSGDTLNGTYRVVAIGERSIEFLYLPLNIQQQLALPARTP